MNHKKEAYMQVITSISWKTFRSINSLAQIKWSVFVSHLKLIFAAGQNAGRSFDFNDPEHQGEQANALPGDKFVKQDRIIHSGLTDM